jgi:hypothetical protein
MPRTRTVNDAISDTQSLIDERNESTVDPVLDILPSLNRAQMFAFDIVARKYPDPLLVPTNYTLAYDTQEMDMPENIFEDRIEKLEFFNNGYYYPCKRISYRDISEYEAPINIPFPNYYCIYGRTIRFLPKATGTFQLRIWAIREPEELVTSQGRIASVERAQNYITVEGIGSDLTTNSDELNNYANIIDGQTGEIKQSLQISSIVGNRITFRTSPLRTTVLNRTISTSISDEVNADDYICVIEGTCVPYFTFPIYNFLVQYASNEMRRKLEHQAQGDDQLREVFEKQIERSWVNRENTLRVRLKSKHWGQKNVSKRNFHY